MKPVPLIAYPILCPTAKVVGGSVPVLVWELTPADEAMLDRYEGFPFLYRKETVRVRLDG
jgi:hypothetical protein